MIYLLQLIIILETISFCKNAFFIFNKNIQTNGLSFIFSQIFSLLIWLNTVEAILFNEITPGKIKIGILIHIGILLTYWSHLQNSTRATFEVNDDSDKAVSNYALFKYIRHPLFTIYLISYFSTFLLFNDLFGIVLSIIITAVFIGIGRNRDLIMLDSEYRSEYEKYMLKTGILVPNPKQFFK